MANIIMPQPGQSVTEGTVVKWLKQVGDQVAADEVIAEIETEKVNIELPSPFDGTLSEILVAEGETVPVGADLAVIAAAGRYSPAVLRLAAEHNLDLSQVSGTGMGGRVTRKDVVQFMERGGGTATSVDARSVAGSVPSAPAAALTP